MTTFLLILSWLLTGIACYAAFRLAFMLAQLTQQQLSHDAEMSAAIRACERAGEHIARLEHQLKLVNDAGAYWHRKVEGDGDAAEDWAEVIE